ncbi:11253_t:CDS:2, partial [Racocetra persica]
EITEILLKSRKNEAYSAKDLLWMYKIESGSYNYFYALADDGTAYVYTIIYALFSLGAIYGLVAAWCFNTSRNLKLFSIFANVVVTILIAKDIAEIIYTIVNRKNYLNECLSDPSNSSNFTSSDLNDLCLNSYNIALISAVIGAIIDTIVLIYFAMIIASYAASRKSKEISGENSTENGSENNTNNVSSEKEYTKKLEP